MTDREMSCDECGRQTVPMVMISTPEGQKTLCKDCLESSEYSLSDGDVLELRNDQWSGFM